MIVLYSFVQLSGRPFTFVHLNNLNIYNELLYSECIFFSITLSFIFNHSWLFCLQMLVDGAICSECLCFPLRSHSWSGICRLHGARLSGWTFKKKSQLVGKKPFPLVRLWLSWSSMTNWCSQSGCKVIRLWQMVYL